MPTINLFINGNQHAIACNDGEEARLKALADKFKTKLEQIAPALKQVDDKTLYLITALVLLDELDESKNANTEASPSMNETELIETVSDKILSIKKLLSVK
jgi:cell division protein ZapA